MILWLMMMHHHTKLDQNIVWANIRWSSEPSLWPWPWIQQSNLCTRHSRFWTCTVKLSWSQKNNLQNQQFRTYNRNTHISLYEPKFSYCDLDLEDRHDILAHGGPPQYQVWLQKFANKHSAEWEQICVTSVTSLTPENTTMLSLF